MDEETHETPFRALSLVDEVFGDATIVHVVPFHCSMSDWFADPLLAEPTAVQLVDDMQVTPLNSLSSAPWFGLGTADHVDPFHPLLVARSPRPCRTSWTGRTHH
jgi:hypothetical protein